MYAAMSPARHLAELNSDSENGFRGTSRGTKAILNSSIWLNTGLQPIIA
jgi:hypothetical protein